MKSSIIFYVLVITLFVAQKINASASDQPQTDKKEHQVTIVAPQPNASLESVKPPKQNSTQSKQFIYYTDPNNGKMLLVESDADGCIWIIGFM